jgi:hypothetical protein
MRIKTFIGLTLLVVFALAAGIAAALRLTRPELFSAVPHNGGAELLDSQRTDLSVKDIPALTPQSPQNNAEANVLELPKASTDFVGYWGGYIHSSIKRLSPDLIGTSPDRVSVVFGRQGDTVFMASKLYAAPNQRIVLAAKARILGPRVAVITYESEDHDLYYVCRHSFQLMDVSAIRYEATFDIYDIDSRKLMGIVTQNAILKRLRTVAELVRFARPARNEVPRAEISAREQFAPHD